MFKGGRFGEGNLSFLLQDKKPNRLSMSSIHLSRPDTLLLDWILKKLTFWVPDFSKRHLSNSP